MMIFILLLMKKIKKSQNGKKLITQNGKFSPFPVLDIDFNPIQNDLFSSITTENVRKIYYCYYFYFRNKIYLKIIDYDLVT